MMADKYWEPLLLQGGVLKLPASRLIGLKCWGLPASVATFLVASDSAGMRYKYGLLVSGLVGVVSLIPVHLGSADDPACVIENGLATVAISIFSYVGIMVAV